MESDFKVKNNSQHIPRDLVKHLYDQIKKIIKPANLSFEAKIKELNEIKLTVSAIIDQFEEEKKISLKNFDKQIVPIAEDVVEEILNEARELKKNITLSAENFTDKEWEEIAKIWFYLDVKWNDRKGIVERIIEKIARRYAHLIEKDIQIVKEYQTHSLSLLPKETGLFKNIETRLANSVEEPLKELIQLYSDIKQPISLQQASEWMSKIQEKREGCFDQLLLRIDHVMKDVVQLEDTSDWSSYVEAEGEVLFMEKELNQIKEDILHICEDEASEREFLLARLEGLSDHLTEFEKLKLPMFLTTKLNEMKNEITVCFSKINFTI